jgi:hypothetical protein
MVKADVFEEETDKSTQTERRGMGPDIQVRIAEITSGRSNKQAGTNNNLQRLLRIGSTKLRRG